MCLRDHLFVLKCSRGVQGNHDTDAGQQINVSAASMKLCSELRMASDVESGMESELAFTLKRLRDMNECIGKRCLQGTPLQLQARLFSVLTASCEFAAAGQMTCTWL
jgi:hypothetical protein